VPYFVNNPKHWRQRADEARAVGATLAAAIAPHMAHFAIHAAIEHREGRNIDEEATASPQALRQSGDRASIVVDTGCAMTRPAGWRLPLRRRSRKYARSLARIFFHAVM
jgi:hypothetical protein